jgi:hypothetical protein
MVEGYGDIAVHTKRGDEGSHELVRPLHFYLMVTRISIKERKGFTSMVELTICCVDTVFLTRIRVFNIGSQRSDVSAR